MPHSTTVMPRPQPAIAHNPAPANMQPMAFRAQHSTPHLESPDRDVRRRHACGCSAEMSRPREVRSRPHTRPRGHRLSAAPHTAPVCTPLALLDTAEARRSRSHPPRTSHAAATRPRRCCTGARVQPYHYPTHTPYSPTRHCLTALPLQADGPRAPTPLAPVPLSLLRPPRPR